jgi:hypothetical protein
MFSARMKSSKLDEFNQGFDVKYFLGGTVLYLASAWFIAWLGGVIGSNVMLAIGVIMGASLVMFGWWVWLGIFAILLIARIPPPMRRDSAD